MRALKKNWYCVFLIAAFVLALFPPTVVLDMHSEGSNMAGAFFGGGATRLQWVFGQSPTFSGRDWQTFLALESLCVISFLFFGLRQPRDSNQTSS